MKITENLKRHQDWIDQEALKIVKTLQQKGFSTYLVGGCVRDLLLGIEPKDFDIATNARPEQVKRSVPQSYVIGKRFRLVLAKRRDQLYEIATFRKDSSAPVVEEGAADEPTEEAAPTPMLSDNVFGTVEEDANRRDFTINALFYDPANHQLLDFTEGVKDLEHRTIKMIGEPVTRLIEDPIRILRGIRLAHKIGFSLDSALRAAMMKTAGHLKASALPRKREEFLKFLRLEDPSLAFLESYDLGVLSVIAPTLDKALSDADPEGADVLVHYLRFPQQLPGLNDPGHLFAPLILGYVRAYIQPDPLASLKAAELMDHRDLLHLMKDELGIFKHEQNIITKAIQLIPMLAKRKELERRGQKRVAAILRTPSLPLALLLADLEKAIASDDWNFWMSLYTSQTPVASSSSGGFNDGGPRRRRRRRRRPPTSAKNPGSTP